MNKSYLEMLDPSKAEDRTKKVEFLKSNGVNLIMGMYSDDIDYELFVGCMEIYEATGMNFFGEYKKLLLHHQYRTLDKGIKNYIGSFDYYVSDRINSNYLNNYKKEVLETIEIMNFFNIGSYNDTDIEQYIEHYNNADTEWQELRNEELDKRKINADATLDKMKNSYFNFDNFDNDRFESIFKECIKDMDMGKNLYTLDEVININVNLDKNKNFIVFLRKNNKVCFVGRTTNLLNYIGSKSKQYEADRVAFYPVDKEYIDDIYIKALVEFDVAIGGAIRNTNRKYISLSSAKRIFKELYKINLVYIKKIIARYDVEKFMIGDTEILDKIELDKAVKVDLGL